MTPPNPIDRLPWFLVLCALLAGCGTDDDCPTCPPVGGGLIEGFVTDGGRTIDDLSVTFESIDDTTYTFEATAPVDSTGRYRINAPPCRGLLRLERRGSRLCYHARDTLTFRNTLAETLRVGHERIQADFRLGRGWIELMLPEEMTDDDIDLELGGMGMYPDV